VCPDKVAAAAGVAAMLGKGHGALETWKLAEAAAVAVRLGSVREADLIDGTPNPELYETQTEKVAIGDIDAFVSVAPLRGSNPGRARVLHLRTCCSRVRSGPASGTALLVGRRLGQVRAATLPCPCHAPLPSLRSLTFDPIPCPRYAPFALASPFTGTRNCARGGARSRRSTAGSRGCGSTSGASTSAGSRTRCRACPSSWAAASSWCSSSGRRSRSGCGASSRSSPSCTWAARPSACACSCCVRRPAARAPDQRAPRVPRPLGRSRVRAPCADRQAGAAQAAPAHRLRAAGESA
jgi:hypothetical protein